MTYKVICAWKFLDTNSLGKFERYYREELGWNPEIKFHQQDKKYYIVTEITAFMAN